jgi:hypothetical protein
MDFESRAQGTIEYLVIIGVVVVVALGVVGVVSDIASTSGVADTQTKAYFESQTPFAIIESRAGGAVNTTADVGRNVWSRELVFVVKNNTLDRLILKTIEIDGFSTDIVTCDNSSNLFIQVDNSDKKYYKSDNCSLPGSNITIQPQQEVIIYSNYSNASFMHNIMNDVFEGSIVKNYEIVLGYESENGIDMKQHFDKEYPVLWEEFDSVLKGPGGDDEFNSSFYSYFG